MDNYCWLRVILKNGGIGVCQNMRKWKQIQCLLKSYKIWGVESFYL